MVARVCARASAGLILFVLCASAGVACGEAPTAGPVRQPGAGGGGSGGSSGTGGISVEGNECICGDDRVGRCTCDSPPCAYCQTCDCASCPGFEPPLEEPFDACGGEPFGFWRGTEFIAPSLIYRVLLDFNRMLGPCSVELGTPDFAFEMRLGLGDGGVLDYSTSGFSTTGRLLRTCMSGLLGYECSDIAPYSDSVPCADTGCGVCECGIKFFGDAVSGRWTRSDTTLELEGAYYDYCVRGDTLELVHTGPDLRYRLSRVEPYGRPTPCDTRMPETCPGAGCALGQCVGADGCDAASAESDCTNRVGCSWDPTLCVGDAESTCGFVDYGRVPGCRFAAPFATCSGAPLPCEPKERVDCALTLGCSWNSVSDTCSGSPTACEGLSIIECGAVPGCNATPA